MPASLPSSSAPSRTATPNPTMASNFTTQAATAEDLLKSQTVGLVNLSDFRKRRAEALEQKEREAEERSLGKLTGARKSGGPGAAPATDRAPNSRGPPTKKLKKRKAEPGKLSFAAGDDETTQDESSASEAVGTSTISSTASVGHGEAAATSPPPTDGEEETRKKRLGPNTSVTVTPKVVTKSALLREAQMREKLRKEFLLMQTAVRATEVVMPFVFYDGTNIPGGMCKVRKGDPVWLFLDQARKVGAERGVGGAGERASSRREWARVGVDDLLLVRGEIIIPHHYEFYYFIVNRTKGPGGGVLFDYSAQPTEHSPRPDTSSTASASATLEEAPEKERPSRRRAEPVTAADETREGFHDDPTLTKVVDRRWYERNKHIFPASVWEEFDPERDYSHAIRRDNGGNAFFFS